MEDFERQLRQIAKYCDQKTKDIARYIWVDEQYGTPRGLPTESEHAVAGLVKMLALSGFGTQASEINPSEFRHARRAVGLLAAWKTNAENLLQKLDEARAKGAVSAQDQNDGQWSPPDSPSGWAKRYGFSWDTLKRRFKDGGIRHQRLSSKSYRIHKDDLPGS